MVFVYLHNYDQESYEKLEPCDDFTTPASYILVPRKDAPGEFDVNRYALTQQQKETLSLEKSDNSLRNIIIDPQPRYGADCSYMTNYLPDKSDERQYYMVGLYQLILFAHGIDNNNQEITKDHVLYDAYQEFSQVMREDPQNPWASLDKELFLEYQLAKIFEKNPLIKLRVLYVIDKFMPGWSYYSELKNLRDANGNPLPVDLLPNEDQMLAFYLSEQVRMLWAATIGQRALNAVTDLRGYAVEALGEKTTCFLEKMQGAFSGMPFSAKGFREKAKEGYHKSFFGVWLSVLRVLLEGKSNDSLDFISFSGHGCIISFDKRLLPLNRYEDPMLASILGFTVLDSEWARDLTPFYMRTATDEQNLLK